MKGVIATHKEGIRYIEHCRVNVTNNRLTFIRKEDAIEKHFSVPYFNISAILLGEGTSLTQKAAKFLSDENIAVGFVGSGCSPLFLASQNEYRPTEYCQKWVQLFFEDSNRIDAAKKFQLFRVQNIKNYWNKKFDNKYEQELNDLTDAYIKDISKLRTESKILLVEARFSISLYRILKKEYNTNFIRKHRNDDIFNKNLDQGNYIAYGLASIVLWNLGIPHSFPVLHGKTRRGGLVFDVADIIKDAYIMPTAFDCAKSNIQSVKYREELINILDQEKVLKKLFKSLKEVLEV